MGWEYQVAEKFLIHRVLKYESSFSWQILSYGTEEWPKRDIIEESQIFTRCFLRTCKLILGLSVRKATIWRNGIQ